MPEVIEKYFTPLNTAVGHYAKSLSAPALFNHIRGTTVINGDVLRLNAKVRAFVEESVIMCQPDKIHIVDGSERENTTLLKYLQEQGTITPLPKYDNCWLARTNPADVARVESKTFICSEKREDTIPTPRENVAGKLGNWISPKDYNLAIKERFPGCMKGRTMYVIPFSMGPVGSSLSKVGIEITDSAYVVCSMKIMTRMGSAVMDLINNENLEFIRCLHSVGMPASGKPAMSSWPCDPERTIILHKPSAYEIVSYGSGYGGNSLLGKKCFALRIGSTLAQKEGWLAEHMLILGVTCPNGQKKYIAAAFPSACGKTNLAMMTPSLPGYKMECVGDDIAWMKFDEHGQLRAINAERGFFGVAPGTSWSTNPSAMSTITKNTIFTNVATTSDGGVYWEGLEDDLEPGIEVTDWLGNPWVKGVSKTPAAHPNSRFCAPCSNCPVIDPSWEDKDGVVISAILFGGRRPTGFPLIHESFNWQHGVYLGAALRSEATAAAEHKGKVILNDPMAMRPFFGYNFAKYLSHWLSMEKRCEALDGILPKIFFVNWFRKDENGRFLWPGYGENSRVIDWILRRCDNEECYDKTPIGLIPSANGGIRLDNMNEHIDFDKIFAIEKDFWLEEAKCIQQYFDDQVGSELPSEIQFELDQLRKRIEEME